jgi:hypothetical protein
MNEQLKLGELSDLPDEAAGLFPSPQPFPTWPWFLSASGLYQWRLFDFQRADAADAGESAATGQPALHPFPIWTIREELRLDIDGRNPQMTVSGTRHGGLTSQVHWIANLSPAGTNRWTGTIWYKNGNTASFPRGEGGEERLRQPTQGDRHLQRRRLVLDPDLPVQVELLPRGRVRVRQREGNHGGHGDQQLRAFQPAGQLAVRDPEHREDLSTSRLRRQAVGQ